MLVRYCNEILDTVVGTRMMTARVLIFQASKDTYEETYLKSSLYK